MSVKEFIKPYKCHVPNSNITKIKINCYTKKRLKRVWKFAGIISIIGSIFAYIGYTVATNANEYSQSLVVFPLLWGHNLKVR